MFVKLFQQILDSSIADDRKLRHFFTDLLLCADGEGYVIMTEMAIARRIGASLEEVEWGLAELQKPDPRSKTKDKRGCRIEPVQRAGYGWRIINYETYRAMRDADQLRETVRLRVRKHRAAKKAQTQGFTDSGNGDVTDGNACNAMQRQNADSEEESNTGETDSKKSNWNPTPQQIEVASWFNRRASTRWDEKEIKAWRKLQPLNGEDFDVVRWLHATSGCDYKRRKLATLLNNWTEEVDLGRTYDPDRSRK